MILSDRDIKLYIKEGGLGFKPKLSEDQIGPASIDLKLGNIFKLFRPERYLSLDVKKGIPVEYLEAVTVKDGDPFILHPHMFVLAATKEYVTIPDDISMKVEGKSTLGRMGLLVHTAGFIDPGFEGHITLELSNQANLPITIYPGMYVCQVDCQMMSSPAEVPYNKRKKSIYSKQRGPTAPNTKNLFEHKG
ncbi:MAG: dCTP deaminase [Patescibacteria group bacterium]